jgi:hypothetical protein
MIAQLNPVGPAPAMVLSGTAGAGRDRAVPDRPRPDLQYLLRRFESISLEQMDGVALQDRIDTKYVFHGDQLLRALSVLAEQYRVLEIDSVRLQHYHTLYFDTDDFALYHRHHARRRNRYKIRSRHYEDTDRSCFEIKLTTHADRTIKRRLQTPEFMTEVTPQADIFLREHLPAATPALRPRLWNDFSRITLVSTQRSERLTLDMDLRFGRDNDVAALPGVVIAEVKQAGHARNSDFMCLMRDEHIRARGFSKYCIGVSLLYPGVKHNNFKPIHRLLDKLMKGEDHVIF